jgi:RHS repeat-associated protein
VVDTQLYKPYGGLSYYHARYSDSSHGQFTSADTDQRITRFIYVGGNPETMTDPTGNHYGPGPTVFGQCIHVPYAAASAATHREKLLLSVRQRVLLLLLFEIVRPLPEQKTNLQSAGNAISSFLGGW